MKKFKKLVRGMVNFYKSVNDNYIPIYTGDELLGFGKMVSL